MNLLIESMIENIETTNWNLFAEESKTTEKEIISSMNLAQAKALAPAVYNHRNWFAIEDKLIALMGEDAAFEWLDENV